MKPIIGITVECEYRPEDDRSHGKMVLNWNYAEAISQAGGVPIVIPPTADAAAVSELIDGWLIPGGADIDARHWGEENHALAELQDPARFASEASLFRAVSKELPIFGICYGCQFLNVIEGGSLIQHLPDLGKEGHSGGTLQRYAVQPSRFAEIVEQSEVSGRSFHHQAIGRVAESLRVVAHSEDSVIEAVESTTRPWTFGVQWHPERTAQDPESEALFREFIAAATRYKLSKRG